MYNIKRKWGFYMDIQFFYTNTLGLSDKELIKTLAVNSKVNFVKKGTIIQNIGDINTELHWLEQGLFRGYFLDVKGHEITDCFGFISGIPLISCLDLSLPAPVCIEALEDSTIVSVPLKMIFQLLEKNMELISLYNRSLQQSLTLHWENKIMLMQYTAIDRYLWFLKRFPGLIDRVSHKYIASFLGITPVSLSRIRKAIRQNEIQLDDIQLQNN